jgi:probable rRNA maturation factor
VNKALSVRIHPDSGPLDARLLRQIAGTLVTGLLGIHSCDLAISVVAAAEMTRLNETFLRHKGSTDVLAFNYGDPKDRQMVFGEIIVCQDEAVRQSGRFHTSWQSELVRYVVHGTLHLLGYDDHGPVERRRMKRQEDHLLRQLAQRFEFVDLG